MQESNTATTEVKFFLWFWPHNCNTVGKCKLLIRVSRTRTPKNLSGDIPAELSTVELETRPRYGRPWMTPVAEDMTSAEVAEALRTLRTWSSQGRVGDVIGAILCGGSALQAVGGVVDSQSRSQSEHQAERRRSGQHPHECREAKRGQRHRRADQRQNPADVGQRIEQQRGALYAAGQPTSWDQRQQQPGSSQQCAGDGLRQIGGLQRPLQLAYRVLQNDGRVADWARSVVQNVLFVHSSLFKAVFHAEHIDGQLPIGIVQPSLHCPPQDRGRHTEEK